MKRIKAVSLAMVLGLGNLVAQDDPAITSWLINTNNATGKHYINGNSTPIVDTAKVNVQRVRYSDNYAYINCSGVPAYIVGPYLDGNPALATNNNWLFQIPLEPVKNDGSLTATPMGSIGVFINGVPMYDYKDGFSYASSSGTDNQMNGDGVWNRNAILAEKDGFDCSKGHPSPVFDGPPGPGGTLAGGSYHHHQNPTAFNTDLTELSDVCDLYLADGLYTISETTHSPLIGFAFDGFPVYGAYGYTNPNEAGSVSRIRSSYQLRDITERTHYADGTDVTDGPVVSEAFPLGWYREDYEYEEGSGDLDIHNGRFCVTPEYPEGTYAYFATVDEQLNSAFPYIVGLEYYGVVASDNFSGMGGNSVSIDESVTEYDPDLSVTTQQKTINLTVSPNPASDFIVLQVQGLLRETTDVALYDMNGRLVRKTRIEPGSTIWYLDARTLYNGEYLIHISNDKVKQVEKIVIQK